jgi:hypothetical protein
LGATTFFRLRRVELFNELWPTDESTETAEAHIANARDALLVAAMFERFVEIGPEEARYYRGLAAERLAKVGKPRPEDA